MKHYHHNQHHYDRDHNCGFTLIEIIVSLALFAVVAVVAIGAFLKIVDADRRSQAIESAVNDTNFALESMVRDLRVGTDYQYSTSDNSTPPPSISHSLVTGSLSSNIMIYFNSDITATESETNQTCSLIHAYELSGTILEKAEQQSCNQSYGSGTYIFTPLTSSSSDLKIKTFAIKIMGTWPPAPPTQPKVFILINGTAGDSQQDQTSFTLQTTASQRIMEY
jgi:prepilin-type N-terminal cleavage/methylation domain-containing protein